MAKALVLARYSATGAAGTVKEGLTGRKKMVQSVVDAMDGELIHFWGVASGDWHVAYVTETPERQENDANTLASLLIGTAAGSLDALRVLPLVDTDQVDTQLSEVMQGYRAPGE